MGDMKTPDFEDLLAAFDIPDATGLGAKEATQEGKGEFDQNKPTESSLEEAFSLTISTDFPVVGALVKDSGQSVECKKVSPPTTFSPGSPYSPLDTMKRLMKPSDSPMSFCSDSSGMVSPAVASSPAIPRVRIKTIKTSSGRIRRTVVRVSPDSETEELNSANESSPCQTSRSCNQTSVQTVASSVSSSVPLVHQVYTTCPSPLNKAVGTLNRLLHYANPVPTYVPNLGPPPECNITLPPRGYRCLECGDSFVVERSLKFHFNRRSVHIEVTCTHCKKALLFFNRCALLAHAREHKVSGSVMQCTQLYMKPIAEEELLAPLRAAESPSVQSSVFKAVQKNPPVMPLRPEHRASLQPLCCVECDQHCSNLKALAGHYQRVSEDTEKLMCKECSMILPNNCSFRAHERVHGHTPPFCCPECGLLCGSADIQSHVQENCLHYARKAWYKCLHCDVVFKSPQGQKAHIQEKHRESFYKCAVCPVAFKTSDRCEMHLKTKHGASNSSPQLIFKCSCETIFKKKALLYQHFQEDACKRVKCVFKCPKCKSIFTLKQQLMQHFKKIHKGSAQKNGHQIHKQQHEKRTVRSEKEKEGLQRKSNLSKDGTKAKRMKRYPCRLCDQSFNFSTSLRKHIRKDHEEKQKQYFCWRCTETTTFMSSVRLKNHMSLMHGIRTNWFLRKPRPKPGPNPAQTRPSPGPNPAQPRPSPGPNPAQTRPKPGPNPAQPRPKPGPAPAQTRPKPGPNPAQPSPGPNPAQPRPKPGPAPAQTRPKPGPAPAQTRPSPGPAPAQTRPSPGPAPAQPRPKPGPNPAQTRPKPGPNPAQTRPKPGPAPAQTRPSPGPNPAQTRPSPGPNPAQTRPKPGPNPAQTRPKPPPAQTRPKPGPNPAQPRPKPGPAPAQTRPSPGPNPAQTRPKPGPNPAQPRPKPGPAPAQTRPSPGPNPAQTRPSPGPNPAQPRPKPGPAPAQPRPKPGPAPAQTRPKPGPNPAQTLTSDLSVLTTDLSVLTSDLSVLTTDLSVLTTDLSVLTTDLSVLTSDLSVLTSDLSVLTSDLSVLTTDLSVLTSDLSVLTTDLSVLTSDLSVLTSDLSVLTSDLSVLTSDLSVLTTDLSVLTSDLSGLDVKAGDAPGDGDAPGEKRLKTCGFVTTDDQEFERHKPQHKLQQSTPQCGLCGLCFTSALALNRHRHMVHKKEEAGTWLFQGGQKSH
uniref:C2H2-type domain-containing protein n=1 Tax=Knipowitschia caucasica TaxID=637954 RepID=A0AAV2L6C5_KNICA